MAKKSRQSIPNPQLPEQPQVRLFPTQTVEELLYRRTALTNSVVIAQQMIEHISHNPDDPGLGIRAERLPIFLAHLTLAYDTLKHLAHYYSRDYELARREETISIVSGPGLVGPDGRPLHATVETPTKE